MTSPIEPNAEPTFLILCQCYDYFFHNALGRRDFGSRVYTHAMLFPPGTEASALAYALEKTLRASGADWPSVPGNRFFHPTSIHGRAAIVLDVDMRPNATQPVHAISRDGSIKIIDKIATLAAERCREAAQAIGMAKSVPRGINDLDPDGLGHAMSELLALHEELALSQAIRDHVETKAPTRKSL